MMQEIEIEKCKDATQLGFWSIEACGADIQLRDEEKPMIHFHRRRRWRPTMPRRLTQFPLLLPPFFFFFFSVFQVFYTHTHKHTLSLFRLHKSTDYIDCSSKLMRIEVRSCCVRFQLSQSDRGRGIM